MDVTPLTAFESLYAKERAHILFAYSYPLDSKKLRESLRSLAKLVPDINCRIVRRNGRSYIAPSCHSSCRLNRT